MRLELTGEGMGGLAKFGVALGLWWFAWWLWPTGLFSTPLAQLTLGALAAALGSVVSAWLGMWAAIWTLN